MRKKFENVGRQLFLRDPSSFSPVIKRSSMKTNGVLEAATPTKKRHYTYVQKHNGSGLFFVSTAENYKTLGI